MVHEEIKSLLGVMIFALIGLALAPTVANQQQVATTNANLTGGANALVGLTTLAFAVVLVLGVFKTD